MISKKISILNLVLISLGLMTGCSSGNKDAKARNRDLSGSELYNKYCMGCHGNAGTAGMMHAANLKSSRLVLPLIIQRISEGKSGMPAFKSKLSDEEIIELAKYVQAFQK